MKYLIVIGIVFFIGSIILIVSNYELYEIEQHGRVVSMRIEKLPRTCFGTRVPYFVTYSFMGTMYEKQTRGNFCKRHRIGEMMNMKMFEDSKYILYPDESVLKNLISFGILGLFGLVVSITQWKKLRR
jgi:hypothetical protein